MLQEEAVRLELSQDSLHDEDTKDWKDCQSMELTKIYEIEVETEEAETEEVGSEEIHTEKAKFEQIESEKIEVEEIEFEEVDLEFL